MTIDTPTIQLWDKLPDESERWYAAFDQYRLLGPSRSVRAAYQIDHPGANQSAAWTDTSREFNWQSRAIAWDVSQRDAEQAEYLANQAKARLFRQKSITALESLLEKAQGVALGRDKLFLSEVSRLAHVAKVIHAESRLEFEPARSAVVINNTAIAATHTVELDITDEDRAEILKAIVDLGLLDGAYDPNIPPVAKWP